VTVADCHAPADVGPRLGLTVVRARHRGVEDFLRSEVFPVLAAAGDIALPQQVAPPELHWIQPQLVGHLIDVALEAEAHLWIARRAHEAAREVIGVDDERLHPDVWDAVRAAKLAR